MPYAFSKLCRNSLRKEPPFTVDGAIIVRDRGAMLSQTNAVKAAGAQLVGATPTLVETRLALGGNDPADHDAPASLFGPF
jgi:hypothetical protein